MSAGAEPITKTPEEEASTQTTSGENPQPTPGAGPPTQDPPQTPPNAADVAADGIEVEKALEILEPMAETREWIIGKPKDMGGKEEEYSVYQQKPLGYIPRMRFFSLVSKNISRALKEGATINLGDIDLSEGIPTRDQLTTADFGDAAGFMALAFQLLAYSPDFLLDCYVLWLDVPAGEKGWAKRVMEQPWDPEREKWGIKEEDGLEMVEVFIDQNYEDTRDFFVNKLPRIAERVRQREAEQSTETGQESGSALSKQ